MTNLTLQPYSTKLAKHQPPVLRKPTEKGESAGLHTHSQKSKKSKRKGGSNLLQTLQPSTAGYSLLKKRERTQTGPSLSQRDGRRRERAVLTSRWSAPECPVLARIARDTHSLKLSPTFPRYQLTNSHGQPVGGRGKRGKEGSSLLPSPLSTVWNYKHYYLGEVLSRAEGGNRKY